MLQVLFTDQDGTVTTGNLDDGKVSYAELSGAYTVTVIDNEGNVIKVFEIVSGTAETPTEPENPNEPEQPETPDDGDEHTHNLYLSSEMSEADGYMILSYACDCGEVFNEKLTVTFTDENGEVIALPLDENGRVDFSELVGAYEVSITDENGEVLTAFDITLNEKAPSDPTEPDNGDGDVTEPENPDDTDNQTPEQPNEDQGGNLAGVLGILLVVLAIGGAAAYFVIKKKKKK